MRTACRTTAAALALLTLTGCAAIAEHTERTREAMAERRAAEQLARDQARHEFERSMPTCTTEPECDAMWDAAQLWIVQNAGMKLQLATDVVLETYSPQNGNMRLGVRAVKQNRGELGSRIEVSVWCGNIFGCMTDTREAALDFNRTVGAAGG